MGWRTISLDGTKDGSNTAFTFPFVIKENSEEVRWNGMTQERISGTPQTGQYRIIRSNVAMGQAPQSGDSLIGHAWEES